MLYNVTHVLLNYCILANFIFPFQVYSPTFRKEC